MRWPFTRRQPGPVALSIQQRAEVMGRMHAGNVAGIADLQIGLRAREDRERALERIREKLGANTLHAAVRARRQAMGHVEDEDPAVVMLRHITGLLERADLTINIKPLSWFLDGSRIKANGPHSFWAHTDSKPGYAARREAVEDEVFGYSAPLVPNTDRYDRVARGVTKHGSPQLDRDGKVTNPDFAPGSRPVYSALNWLSLPEGGASKYGHVYLVLQPYLKHKTTFLHEDTFNPGVADPAKLANHFNYYPLICNCKDDVLDALMQPYAPRSASIARHEYVDAQIHSEVLFRRDVKRVVFRKSDFIANAMLGGMDAFNRVKPNFEKFARYNGLQPEYL